MAVPDFSKIWASKSPLTPYEFSDEDYLDGWEFIGEIPPDRRMLDTWQKQADTKMLWLKNNMLGYLLRQNSTQYAVGDVAFSASLPSSLVLECTTEGTTAATEPDFSGAVEDGTVTDGTVVWTYKGLLSDDGANTDLSNLTATGEARFSHVVTEASYDDVTGDWYRVYADGWVEQGGIITTGGGSGTINLLKPMADTKYTVQLQGISSNTGLSNAIFVSTVNTTTFAWRSSSSQNDISWVVYGMGVSA